MSDYDDGYDDYWDDDEPYSPTEQEVKDDFFILLSLSIPEIAGLRQAFIEGKIDGNYYYGPCACPKGTIANIRWCSVDNLAGITLDASLPAEQWFLQIKEGDTPENNEYSALAVQWIDEFVAGLKK